MIKVNNLTRKYGSFVAVNSITFSIERGQIVGLLGHNGAGKTTTLKMLTGYLEPTAGDISICGLNILNNRLEVQKKIGYLSEQSPLYPEMPVWQYLEYVAELRGIPEEKRGTAIRQAIEATDLKAKSGELISTLSKGYKQRVGVAQAIIHKPEILILDEPTNGLDPTQIQAMRELIKNLSRTTTIILSTHIMQEVEAVCDRVLIILNGRMAIDSNLSQLKANNNITLSVKEGLSEVQNAISSLKGIKNIQTLPTGGKFYSYRIETDQPFEGVAPEIARKIISQGWDLYGLNSEFRDLESIFKEVNSGIKGANHV